MNATEENAVLSSDQILCWHGPKRKSLIAGTKIGRLVLTDQRLIFLAMGTVTWPIIIGSALGGLPRTEKVDMSALENEGSFSVNLEAFTRYEILRSGLTAYLSISFVDPQGTEVSYALSGKNALPGGKAWREQFDRFVAGHRTSS